MGNLLVNIRFRNWHLQLERGKWRPTLGRNRHYDHAAKGWPDGRFKVYDFFGLRG